MNFVGPLFIVGMPRSGTKLLRDLLNRHSLIGIAGIETEFLPWLARRFARFGDLRERSRFHAFYAHMVRQNYFRLRRERGKLIDAHSWYAACREFSAAGVFEALMRVEVAAAHGSARIWGDKSPSYVDDLPLLKQLYPQAKVVHIIRDVRDYCLSTHKAWGKDMLRAAQRWVDGVRKARTDAAALAGDYLELRYEDLVTAPEAELRRVCAFVGVAFEPRMLTLARPAEDRGDARGARHVVSDNYGKFSRAMSQPTLSRIEELAAPTLLACGYELALPLRPVKRLSMLELRLAHLRDAWHLVRSNRGGWGFWRTALFHIRYFATTRG